VQDSLWLLPLLALAHPRWRDHLAWAMCEAAYFVGVWLYAAAASAPNRGLPGSAYSWFVVVRLLVVIGLIVITWREAWDDERDRVRHPDPDAVSLVPAAAHPRTQQPAEISGAEPGYPGQEPGYPGQEPGYPGQEPGYPGQEPGYPGQEPGYPGGRTWDAESVLDIDDPLGGPLEHAPDRIVIAFA
jgi:hypothetical protein